MLKFHISVDFLQKTTRHNIISLHGDKQWDSSILRYLNLGKKFQ